jgi:deoxyribodipyrimidine photo-lyase
LWQAAAVDPPGGVWRIARVPKTPPRPRDDAAPALVWFRQDLRLSDNPALNAAVESGRPVVGLFVLDDVTPGSWRLGGAARWWLHQSLSALERDLAARGCRLILRRGDAGVVVPSFAAEIGAALVTWNRLYDTASTARDSRIKADLKAQGRDAASYKAGLLFEPWEIETKGGEPFKVFTPFWRACLARGVTAQPSQAPKRLAGWAGPAAGDALADWALTPTAPDWAGGMRTTWTPGERGGQARLAAFLDGPVGRYPETRNLPAEPGTSRLSPHLHWGEISPLQVWSATQARAETGAAARPAVDIFAAELGWREFAHHLLYFWPTIPSDNWKASFDAFPWREDAAALRAWRKGRTGYPIVDAGMRELWATGWMHNRVRMITASFLIKHLMIDWRRGEDWFWDTLVDADLAVNAASWQWVAGSGADAAPYFRIFNPIAQGETYDPSAAYVRHWLPELANVPDAVIHKPWEAGALALQEAGVTLGKTYPAPIVDHAAARARALAAFASVKAAA